MTLQEAYDKALKIDGKYASVNESMQTVDLYLGGTMAYFTVRCGEMFGQSDRSFDDCFVKIAQMDPDQARADKIDELKATLADLES